jgi:5'-phosphate synthase pdxT subunit
VRIGVLALQGGFARHRRALSDLGVATTEVRKPEQLEAADGLVIPGGESTTLLTLIDAWDFVPALRHFHEAGRPIFGTCAGLILLAREVEHPAQPSLGFIDLTAERNAYGRQKESFETELVADLGAGPRPVPAVFIRAPRIRRLGPAARCLARHGGECVMARQDNVLVAAFHPELTEDRSVHRYFLGMVEGPVPAGRRG